MSRLVRLKSVSSTQTAARRLAERGAPDGTLVWALRQTMGRGRMGRRWRSGPGGLYVSWLLRPKFPPERLADFSLACGAAAAAALRDAAKIEMAVKPPNDVLVLCADGRYRKICGILCEASGGASSLDWLVVGIGVNVNNAPPLRRAVSLRALTGRRVGLETVLLAVMRRMTRARRAGDFV
ncbi:MAG: biotin--[acetyl-CoA-carboxylase] ligase [Elusimicrobia bacterium RBG_16_66_12]|nr:MAG: biotin--[acetyl-CoA-carboxylase] ligase [Elusimicrobia bacterium RBG_16_66_12]